MKKSAISKSSKSPSMFGGSKSPKKSFGMGYAMKNMMDNNKAPKASPKKGK